MHWVEKIRLRLLEMEFVEQRNVLEGNPQTPE
jgi:hypothetical protein